MPMIAMCMPILPGKKAMWLDMMNKVNEEPMATNSNRAAKMREFTSEPIYRKRLPETLSF